MQLLTSLARERIHVSTKKKKGNALRYTLSSYYSCGLICDTIEIQCTVHEFFEQIKCHVIHFSDYLKMDENIEYKEGMEMNDSTTAEPGLRVCAHKKGKCGLCKDEAGVAICSL